MSDQVIFDIVRIILQAATGPLLDALENMVKGEKARRIEEIRTIPGSPLIDAELARLEAEAKLRGGG